MSRWFRHYAGMMRDEKLVWAAVRSKQSVERTVWVWGAILESAAEINDGGRYEIEPGEIAYFLRSTVDDIVSIIDAFLEVERISDGCVANWGKRQFQSDSSAVRQKGHRDRKKDKDDTGNLASDGDVTADNGCSDGDVTAADRHGDGETPRRDVSALSMSSSSPSSTESPKEVKEVSEEKACGRPEPWPFDEFWKLYPRKVEKKAAIAALKRVQKSGAVAWDALISAVRAYAATADPQFTKHPTTWLSKGCWDDQPDLTNGAGNAKTPEYNGKNEFRQALRELGEFARSSPEGSGSGREIVQLLPAARRGE